MISPPKHPKEKTYRIFQNNIALSIFDQAVCRDIFGWCVGSGITMLRIAMTLHSMGVVERRVWVVLQIMTTAPFYENVREHRW